MSGIVIFWMVVVATVRSAVHANITDIDTIECNKLFPFAIMTPDDAEIIDWDL